MKINFRQGVIRHPVDIAGNASHIVIGSPDPRYVDLISTPEPTILTVTHGDEDYTIEENSTIRQAWGPFEPTGETQYLYWEIDLVSGGNKRGFTLFPPIVAAIEPQVVRENQHWYDLTEQVMKVYDSRFGKYVPVLRVFGAVYDHNATIVPYGIGSQVGITNDKRNSGFILFDSDGEPIRNRRGKFVTTEHALIISTDSSKSNGAVTGFKLEGRVQSVYADGFIPKLSCVSLVGPRKVELGSYSRTDRVVSGLIGEDMYPGEKGRLVTSGQIHDPNWNFPLDSINKYVFCGMNGEVTLTPPPSGMSQIVGRIIDEDTILFAPEQPVILH